MVGGAFSSQPDQVLWNQPAYASGKERECGRGSARAFVVQDDDVLYADRSTTKGLRTVNARMFDARERYRQWTGGGFRVHASLSVAEANHHIRMLLDRSPAEYLSRATVSGLALQWRCGDTAGARGWKTMEQLLGALDAVTPCVLLFGTGQSRPLRTPRCARRLTILTEDRWYAVLALNGRPSGRSNRRLFYEADVGGDPVQFDLRQMGEGYFDPRWEREMMQRNK